MSISYTGNAMRTLASTLILIVALSAGACSRRESRNPTYERSDADPNSAARKAGHAAYGVAQETEKLAKKAGQKLKEASHQAHEGWKEASDEHKEKGKVARLHPSGFCFRRSGNLPYQRHLIGPVRRAVGLKNLVEPD